MNPDKRAAVAAQLAEILPALDVTERGPLGLLDRPGDGSLGQHDADLHLALLVEVRSLLAENPELSEALSGGHGGDRPKLTEEDRTRIRRLTDRSLERTDGQRPERLWALLGGEGATAAADDRRRGRRPAAAFSNGLLARSLAALWMNLIVIAIVALVVATPWAEFDLDADGLTLSVALLELFALWCLSFLPGWLYVRFLGQRAGALWNEFVIHLHRLGCDHPCFLPRPPASSEYFLEWLRAGGPLYDQQHNLYRQKFDAYYGKAVVEGVQGTNFSVRVDTMFPVFLATAVLAVGWTTILWDPTFLIDPSSIWDMLRFAFLGAYAFIVQSLIRRFFQSDLRPSAYAAAIVRVIVVLLVMTALHQVMIADGQVEAAVAFMVGIFPIIALQALERMVASALRVVVPQLSPDYPLNQLDGLNVWYESRLLEEGVEDMQNLTTANIVDIVLHTRVPVGRLIDWVDQATLYLHLDRAERGWGERRLVRQARKDLLEWEREKHAPPNPAETRPGALSVAANGATPPQEQPGADEETAGDATSHQPGVPTCDSGDRTRGSVNYALRAGTKTRVALRQVGIRTATDLLKAFPPDEIDPTEPSQQPARPQPPLPTGLEPDQIRTLVRVLHQDGRLALVWNWQTRGVAAADESRRPRPRGRPGTTSSNGASG